MLYYEKIQPILEQYTTFLLDQWGVLHDGVQAYPNVVKTLTFLQEQNKEVIIVSNSGKRSEFNTKVLEKCGIARNLYQDVVSSGEVFWHECHKQTLFPTAMQTCYMINKGSDGVLDGLPITKVENITDADFIILASIEQGSHQEWIDLLLSVIDKNIPLVCLNADVWSIQNGKTTLNTGHIANVYEQNGGTVMAKLGKPFPLMYQYAFNRIKTKDPKIIVIGDSMEHDIAMANEQNVDSLLIIQGILSSKIKEDMPIDIQTEKLIGYTKEYNAIPTYFAPWFAV